MARKSRTRKQKSQNKVITLASNTKFLTRVAKIFCDILRDKGEDSAREYLQYKVHFSFWDPIENYIYRELQRRGYTFPDGPTVA